MRGTFFGIVIYAVFLNPPLMCQIPGNSPAFYRAETLHPGEEASVISVQYVFFAEVMYSSSDKWIFQCFFLITVKTHTILHLKFQQLILCKFIAWYQSRREINAVKQHSGQARKTPCFVLLTVKNATAWKPSGKYNEYRSPYLYLCLCLYIFFFNSVFKNMK